VERRKACHEENSHQEKSGFREVKKHGV
jgi:hypothetical protein